MSTRREFIVHSAAAGALAAASSRISLAGTSPLARIRGIARRDDTIIRYGGSGDNYHMTWGADDRQYAAVCDGFGWFKAPKAIYNSRLWAIQGGPTQASFQDVPGYPDLLTNFITQEQQRYYCLGTLAVDKSIYQFLSTQDYPPLSPDGSDRRDRRWTGAKLIYSRDQGHTWCNQDGATPVVWERWEERSRENMVFFAEPQNAFSLLSVLQMGRNYEANRDGYVYIYGPNGVDENSINQLVMFRVPKARIVDRGAYEYFAGIEPDGTARWTKQIEARGVVHTFPGGWVGKGHYAWQPSVSYNKPLGLYMMATWGWCFDDEGTHNKASYLGFWVADNPWGPWIQVHEETAWRPGSDAAAFAYQPQIAPKWIAADGKSFWLVWTDYQGAPTFDQECERLLEPLKREKATAISRDLWKDLLAANRRLMPYYSFNTQRVDLIVA